MCCAGNTDSSTILQAPDNSLSTARLPDWAWPTSLRASPAAFFQGLPNIGASGQNFLNLYATDSWRTNAAPDVQFRTPLGTVFANVGETTANSRISTWADSWPARPTRAPFSLNAPYGFYFPGDPGFPGDSGAYNQWDHFDPRGGLAVGSQGDGKCLIRAGYAYGYAYIPGVSRLDQAGFNPWGGRSTYLTGPSNFATPYATIPGGNPFPTLLTRT